MLRITAAPGDLEAFLAVAETGSFRRSAERLGLSQPAVSARIQNLENCLGVPLFHRTTRRVVITEAGERLRMRIEHTMGELRDLVREFDDEANLRRGRVALGASPSVAAAFLPRILSAFRTARPAIEVRLHDDFYGRALDRLLRQEVDMAVVPFEPDDDRFASERLFSDRFVLAVADSHRFADLEAISLGDIADETLISMPPESAAWATFDRAFAAAGLEFRPSLQTRNSLTSLGMIQAGYGIGLVTELLATTLGLDRVRLVRVENAELERHIGIVTQRGRALSPAARALIAALRTASSKMA